MTMYLKKFGAPIKCCCFDIAKGEGGTFEFIEDRKTTGFCLQGDYGWVAIYPDDGVLTVQINMDKWRVLPGETEVTYFHDYNGKVTSFYIKDRDKSFDFTYRSWWADSEYFEINPMAASCEEENPEEDVFGYVAMLNENEDVVKNLVDFWGK